MTTPFKEITSGLKFPEGPVAMPDGSVILVEIARETLTRVTPDDGDLVDFIAAAIPEPDWQKAVLVDNPARLYGFEKQD